MGRHSHHPGEPSRASRLIGGPIAQGITVFGHADVYKLGKSEAIFGSALQQTARSRGKLVIISKGRLRLAGDEGSGDPKRLDFSHSEIIRPVEAS